MSIPNAIDISFRLKEIRNTLGLSRSELADKVLISRSHLSNIENCNRDMTVELVCELNKQFKVSSDYLLFGRGSMFVGDEEEHLSIYNLSNTEKIEVLLKLYHYFAGTREFVYDNDGHDVLEYLRTADKEIWLEYAKRIDDKIKVVDLDDKQSSGS